MKKRYIVNAFQGFLFLCTAGMLAYLFVMALIWGRMLWSVLLFLGSVIFLIQAGLALSVVNMEETHVDRKLLGFILQSFPLESIGEIGVLNIRVLGRKNNGRKQYIYFSKHRLSEKERFRMCLEWPPKDKIYMTYSPKRYLRICSVWNGEIVEYNIADES